MIKPPLHWIGGKQQHLDALREVIPTAAQKRFHEPFIGGASVFLSIEPESGTINDLNSRLVNFYRQVRDRPADLIGHSRSFRGPETDPDPRYESDPLGNRAGWPSDTYFYQQRARLNAADGLDLGAVERASLFLYLNRCSYNGLYRENSDGLMNMARGSRTNPDWVREPQIRSCSYSLGGGTSAGSTIESWSDGEATAVGGTGVDARVGESSTALPSQTDGGRDTRLNTNSEQIGIYNTDFRYILDEVQTGDVVYFDPPYQPLSSTADFTSYTAEGFTPEDRDRLCDVCTQLIDREVTVIVSDSNETASRYRDLGFDIRFVDGKRCVNINAEDRGPVREVVAVWYAPDHESGVSGTQSSLSAFGQ